jgi:hypothetical protein
VIQQLIKKFGVFVFVLLASTLPGQSQNLTGIWRGYFITSSSDHYKFELQIKQSNTGISGVSYSYLNTVFYGKATLTGTYNKTGKKAVIKEIKTVELRMSVGSSACIMKCLFEYSKSGREEYLEGTYTSVFETDGLGHMKGEDCGGGKVFLRRVTTSDFYIEPFLRKKDGTASTTPNTKPPATTKVTPKTDPPTSTEKKPPITKTPTTKPKSNPVTTRPNTNTAKSKPDTTKKSIEPPPVVKKEVPVATPNALKTRSNELVKTFQVSDEEVTIKLYDNGEIDDDTISVYMDKKLVLSAKRLTASPLIIKIRMDEENSEHELVMVAENLGRIPPNTSLMIVESGDQRFDARITSTEQKNAVVRFRYVKPK